ncbi:MAG: glycoside hydrolase family 13 protein [Defluviitaleaceae bacterium]|nr:glycoside hydrolase family 13 protein [Defluviitaleaceae bacterium]
MKFFNKSAVFSDETEQFIKPYNPKSGEHVQFSLRVAQGDTCTAALHIVPTSWALGAVYPMRKTKSDDLFDYFTVDIQIQSKPIRYYYSLKIEGETLYYNKIGLRTRVDSHYNFRLVPGLCVPDWARGAVMYQIFVDRFYNGDKTNDVVKHEYAYLGKTAMAMEWGADIGVGDFCNFYGGDLKGIMEKMPYLKSLGVEVIYLNPIFVSPSSHKYDTQDYDYIDPHFGVIKNDGGNALQFEKVNNIHATKYIKRTTDKENLEASNALFAEFVTLAHAHGMKVILDGVFNHCGSFNKWLDVAGFYKESGEPIGAFHSKDSPYHHFFLWHQGGEWPENDHYDGWWANSNHPKLCFETSQELFDYILEVGKKWVSPPYNVDGWRLDVAADLGQSPEMNHKFWRAFHDAVKGANPEAIILAEHYGDPSPWLNGREWDTIMNYDAFMEPLTWFLTGVNKHSEEGNSDMRGNAMAFEGAMRHNMALLNIHALQSAMNQLSNHDHSRFLTRTSGATGRWHTVGARAAERGTNKNIMMEAVVFQMTWPGAPTVYYGDEAGLHGWTDPDNRRTFPWGNEDPVLMDLHKILIAMRQELPVLRKGSVEFLWMNQGFISFGRWDDKQKVVVAINNNLRPMEVVLPVWKIGVSSGCLTERIATGGDNFRETLKKHAVNNGEVKLIVPIQGAIVLVQ